MKRIIAVVILILVFVIISIFWWQNGILPVNSPNNTPKIFVVKNGQGVREIANNLKTEGLIRDPVVFFLIIRKGDLDRKIQAGDFRLNPSMNAYEVAESLTHGTLDIWITVPEGYRAEEIADILAEKIPNYDTRWRQVLNQNEGDHFPDTYPIPRDADINTIISIFKNNFQTK